MGENVLFIIEDDIGKISLLLVFAAGSLQEYFLSSNRTLLLSADLSAETERLIRMMKTGWRCHT